MKKILTACIALYLLVPPANAQDEDDEIRRPAIGVSFFLNDFETPQRIRSTSLAQVLRDKSWANMNEMSPGIGIHFFKGIQKHIDFAAALEGSFVRYPFPDKTFSSDRFLLEASATANFKMTSEKFWVQPYIIAGVGGHMYSKYWGAFLPLGLGLKVNFYDDAHLFITSQYRVPITVETSNYHFNNTIGIAGAIGKKKEPKIIPVILPPADQDGDGIIDASDKCPTVKGLAKYDGCPIPDSDRDGINDEEDKCPTVPGLAKYQGCPVPDTDKDGINDEEDKCPAVVGVVRYQGCPIPDTDGDGVNDEEDKCPNRVGPRDNFGCPIIGIKSYAIVFKTGSSILLPAGKLVLDTVVTYLNNNPEVNVTIDGHTDNTGGNKVNQPLSKKRAEATKKYIASKGIDPNRMVTEGYGSTQPIADNKTAKGRSLNRRIEIRIQ